MALAARWQNRSTPFPDMLGLLLGSYGPEPERRDLNHNGVVDEQEFVKSHAPVVLSFACIDRRLNQWAQILKLEVLASPCEWIRAWPNRLRRQTRSPR